MAGRLDNYPSFDLFEWLFHQDVTLHGAELIQWLNLILGYRRQSFPAFSDRLMQIFIGDLEESDVEMCKQDFAKLWLRCGTSTCFDILLHRFNGFVRSMPTSERFRFVANIISAFEPPVLTLRKIELCSEGISRREIVLKQFYMLHRSEVLHRVARALVYQEENAHLDLWTDIEATAIQNGADPVTVSDGRTPLLVVLLAPSPGAMRLCLSMRSMSKRLQRWSHLLASANVDLSTYVSRESNAWQSVGVDVSYHMFNWTGDTTRLWAVQYDAWNQRYAVHVRHETRVPLKLLHYLPGSFTGRSLVPTTICWDPSNEEAEEGHWTAASSGGLVLVGEVMDLHDVISLQDSAQTRTDLYEGLINSTQDDNGVLIRVFDKSCRGRRLRKRSSSQPNSMASRRYDYNTARYSDSHEWLPLIHYCIGLSAWVIENHRDPRDCARYDVTREDGHEIKVGGFLAKARICQTWGFVGRGREQELHDFTEGCPSGCGKINFSALTIPQSLPYWHPGNCGPPE